MNTETQNQLNSIRQILESLEAGWLQMFMNADSSVHLHNRVLSVMTRDIHTQISDAEVISRKVRVVSTEWPDTTEQLVGKDTTNLAGFPDELIRISLARARAVSSLVADACGVKYENCQCSPMDIDDAVWDVQGRVAEVIALLPSTPKFPENQSVELISAAS